MAGKNMKNEGMMRLCPVQINRDGSDGNVRQRERYDDCAPQGQAKNAGKEQGVLLGSARPPYAALEAYFKAQTMLCALPHIGRAYGARANGTQCKSGD